MSSSSVAPAKPTTSFNVTSETGLLRQVLVHTPGREMELVSPENRLELLFDDILFVGHARREHETMCQLFEKFHDADDVVLQIDELLRTALEKEDARAELIEDLCKTLPDLNLRIAEKELQQLSPEELQTFLLTGESPIPATLQPLPNLMFTRDLAAVVHGLLILSHAARAARSRENLITKAILNHHPDFEHLKESVITLPPSVTFEGGDLLVASPEVVLIGHSERTSYGATMAIAHELFERTSVEHVLMVDLPKKRSCMHLDTVFTFATPNECVVFPPLVEKSPYGYAVHITPSDTPGKFFTDMRPNLHQALEDLLDRELTFIPCGGPELINQEREQWTDGANLFAIAPGVVVGYERNRRTFEQLSKHGYRTVSASSFLDYYEGATFEPGEKLAITLEGTELSRGRGGPRCMTLPLSRDAEPAANS